MKLFIASVAALLFAGCAHAQVVTLPTTTSYSIVFTISPKINRVVLSNTALRSTGPIAAGTVVGAVTIDPVDAALVGPVVLGGTSASKFVLSGCAVDAAGKLGPCNLQTAVQISSSSTEQITLTATQQ